ncbi:MAG: guanylate kinase [Chthoniobacter sp.]|uniref:guanylate kinase n=1 Tax=Chthoniobacter sp. TaxID=2510640 RepID=UPI0032A15178
MNNDQPHSTESAGVAPREFRRLGILFVVSAPSGAGKSTVLNALRQTPDFAYSVSYTTRAPRPGEVHGEDYLFVSMEEFQQRLAGGEFLEYAEVHGNYYGTLRSVVVEQLHDGVDVLIDIDVQGARQIRADQNSAIRDAVADIFIMPPSLDELRRRLNKRGTETPEQIEIRLHNAATEMEAWRDYRYTIISGSIEEDLQKFRNIMRAERYLTHRMVLLP